jgi:hypothetical protein
MIGFHVIAVGFSKGSNTAPVLAMADFADTCVGVEALCANVILALAIVNTPIKIKPIDTRVFMRRTCKSTLDGSIIFRCM